MCKKRNLILGSLLLTVCLQVVVALGMLAIPNTSKSADGRAYILINLFGFGSTCGGASDWERFFNAPLFSSPEEAITQPSIINSYASLWNAYGLDIFNYMFRDCPVGGFPSKVGTDPVARDVIYAPPPPPTDWPGYYFTLLSIVPYCPAGTEWIGPGLSDCGLPPPPPPPSASDAGKNVGACPTSSPEARTGDIGNPCNAAIGNKYQSEEDFRTPDGSLVYTRHYNSLANAGVGLGFNWNSTHHRRLEISGTTVQVRSADGRAEPFTCSSTTCEGDADTKRVLVKDSTGYTLFLRDGSRERYDLNGRLSARTDASGRTTNYTYNGNGRLTQVKDPFGHALAFDWIDVPGTLTLRSLTDAAGQTIQYSYVQAGGGNNPVRVDYPDGSAKIYHYENSAFPNHLAGISYIDVGGATVRFATYAYDANGKAISTEHAGGIEHHSLQYDSTTQTTVTDATGTQEVMTFNENLGLKTLTQVVNQGDGKTLNQVFDAQNNLTCKKDEEGRVTTYTYNSTNQKTSITEGLSGTCAAPLTTNATRVMTYQYVSPTLDLPTAITSPSVNGGASKTVAIAYGDSAHPNLPTSIAQSGFTPLGNPVARSVGLAYTATGQVASINGPRTDVNDVTVLAYYTCTTGGACGQLQSVTNALGHVTTFDTYDANGRLTQMTDPNGVVTAYTYDPRGRVATMTVTPPAGAARLTQYTYNAANNVTSVTFPDGMTLAYTYDAAQKLRQVIDNVGNKVTYDYDLKGNRTEEQTFDPDGTLVRSLATAYDIRNRLAQMNNGGSIAQQINDAIGNLTRETDPNQVAAASGISTNHQYDTLNRLIQTVNNLSGVTNYGYDVADRLTQVQAPNSATTQYQYDDLGNLLRETSADRGTTFYTYDDAGNLKTMTDARGVQTVYAYDALNRLTAIDYPGTAQDVSYTYDSGSTVACAFGVGRLCSVTDESGATNYAYDAFGNVALMSQTILSVNYVSQYTYDARDRLTSVTYPDGAIASYTRDPIGRISAVSTTVSGQTTALASGITYRADGLVTGRTFGNGLAESRLYDVQGRVRNQFIGNADTRVYDYDPNNNLVSLQSLPQVSTYGYDALDRLTQDTFGSTGLGYDPNGNRVLLNQGAASTNYAYAPNTNRLQQQSGANTASFTYDANGNITADGTHAYIFDVRNYLTNFDATTSYRYNAQAQRVVKTVGTQTTVYLYDVAGHLLAEADASGSIQVHYVYMNDEPIAMLAAGSAAPIDKVIDNTASGVQFEGDWPSSTAVAGFEGTDYQVHVANGAPPGGIVIDNGGPGFTTTGDWPTSTAVAGFEGTNYQNHSANGAPPGGVVVDNSAGTAVAGTWPTSTAVAGFEGANYQTHAAGTGTSVFRWNLNASPAGQYQVFAKWTAHANRATDAKYTVYHASGASTVTVNQRQSGGQWNLLGTFNLDGTSRVELTDQANGYVVADAVMAVPVGAAPNTATWTPAIAASGNYRVYAKWTAHANRATDATYTVVHASGSTPVTVNQQTNGGQWNLLGTFAFTAGASGRIELTDQANGYVIADAIKLVPEGAAPNSASWPLNPPAAGQYQVFAKWTAHANRATDAKYTVYHASGASTVTVNQQQSGGQWNLLGTFNLDGNSRVELTDQANGYVVADAVRLVATGGTTTTLQTLYLHSDHLGTPRLATNATGAVVWRWDGTAFGGTSPNQDADGDGVNTTINLRFPGQYYDAESSLHYNHFRYYDPKTGRYLTSDPIGLLGGLNTYLYVGGNPLNFFDSLGLFPKCDSIILGVFDVISSRTEEEVLSKNYGFAFVVTGPSVSPNLDPRRLRQLPIAPSLRTEVWWALRQLLSIREFEKRKTFQRLKFFCTEVLSDECGNTREFNTNFERTELINEVERLTGQRIETREQLIRLLFVFDL